MPAQPWNLIDGQDGDDLPSCEVIQIERPTGTGLKNITIFSFVTAPCAEFGEHLCEKWNNRYRGLRSFCLRFGNMIIPDRSRHTELTVPIIRPSQAAHLSLAQPSERSHCQGDTSRGAQLWQG